MVSSLSIAGMIFTLLISFLFPVVLGVFFIKKYRTGVKPLLTGMLVFIIFALILEQAMHFLVIGQPTALANTIKSSPWLYGAYGGLAAGIFEETGRLLAFLIILKNCRKREHGIVYGIGHGGVESILLISSTYVNNIIISVMINNGMRDSLKATVSPEQTVLFNEQLDALINTDFYVFLIAGIERIFTVIIHIALSLLILYAIKNKKYIFFILSILLHALLNFPATVIQSGQIENEIATICLTEGWVALFAAAGLVFIIKYSKTLLADSSESGTIPNLAEE